jgi:hypothetical protein
MSTTAVSQPTKMPEERTSPQHSPHYPPQNDIIPVDLNISSLIHDIGTGGSILYNMSSPFTSGTECEWESSSPEAYLTHDFVTEGSDGSECIPRAQSHPLMEDFHIADGYPDIGSPILLEQYQSCFDQPYSYPTHWLQASKSLVDYRSLLGISLNTPSLLPVIPPEKEFYGQFAILSPYDVGPCGL